MLSGEINAVEEVTTPAKYSETETLWEVLSNIHNCKDGQFQEMVEDVCNLKVFKNKIIKILMQENEEIYLENLTFRFIVSTLESPNAISDIR